MPGRFNPSRSASLPFLAVYLVAGIGRKKEHIAGGPAPWLVYLIPVWGLVQMLAHTTASSVETRKAVLRWGALAGVFFLTQQWLEPAQPGATS